MCFHSLDPNEFCHGVAFSNYIAITSVFLFHSKNNSLLQTKIVFRSDIRRPDQTASNPKQNVQTIGRKKTGRQSESRRPCQKIWNDVYESNGKLPCHLGDIQHHEFWIFRKDKRQTQSCQQPQQVTDSATLQEKFVQKFQFFLIKTV